MKANLLKFSFCSSTATYSPFLRLISLSQDDEALFDHEVLNTLQPLLTFIPIHDVFSPALRPVTPTKFVQEAVRRKRRVQTDQRVSIPHIKLQTRTNHPQILQDRQPSGIFDGSDIRGA
jgi:hypothetical protein